VELTIFKDDQVVLLGNGVDFLPSLEAERGTGGVLTTAVGNSR